MKKQQEIDGFVFVVSAVLGGVGIALAISAAITVVRGFVLSLLWGWFMVPTFSAPALGIAAAIGVAIVAGRLNGGSSSNEKGWKYLGLTVSRDATALGIGWVVKMFM